MCVSSVILNVIAVYEGGESTALSLDAFELCRVSKVVRPT